MSLLGALKKIDEIPGYIRIDKEEEYQNCIQIYSQEYPIITKVAEGDQPTISTVVDNLMKKYRGLSILIPKRNFNSKENLIIQEYNLDKLLGEDLLKPKPESSASFYDRAAYQLNHLIINKFWNITSLTTLVSLIFGLALSGKSPEGADFTYTNYFMGAIVGAGGGVFSALTYIVGNIQTKKDAKYLDEKICKPQDSIPR